MIKKYVDSRKYSSVTNFPQKIEDIRGSVFGHLQILVEVCEKGSYLGKDAIKIELVNDDAYVVAKLSTPVASGFAELKWLIEPGEIYGLIRFYREETSVHGKPVAVEVFEMQVDRMGRLSVQVEDGKSIEFDPHDFEQSVNNQYFGLLFNIFFALSNEAVR